MKARTEASSAGPAAGSAEARRDQSSTWYAVGALAFFGLLALLAFVPALLAFLLLVLAVALSVVGVFLSVTRRAWLLAPVNLALALLAGYLLVKLASILPEVL